MDLFPKLPESLSPMEEWRQRHKVGLYSVQSGYRASTADATAFGESKEDALKAWAEKVRVKCWDREELDRRRDERSH